MTRRPTIELDGLQTPPRPSKRLTSSKPLALFTVTLPEGLSWLQATLTWGGGQSLPSPCKTAFPGFLRQCIPWRMRDEQTRSDHVTRNAKAREKARTWYSREVLARHAKTKLADKRGTLLVKAFRCWRSCHLQRRSVLWVSAFVHV